MEDIGRDCLVATYSQHVLGLILDPVFFALRSIGATIAFLVCHEA